MDKVELSTSTGMVVFNTTLQEVVPEPVRGRIYTLFDISWNSMRLLSLAAGGLIVDALGVQVLYWGSGALLVLAGLLGISLNQKPSKRIG